MKRLTITEKCLKCNAVYDVPLIKLVRLNFFQYFYQRCNCCGRWAWHKEVRDTGPLSQKEESETKE